MKTEHFIFLFTISICSTLIALRMWLQARKEAKFYQRSMEKGDESIRALTRELKITRSMRLPDEAIEEIHRLNQLVTRLEGELLMGTSIVEQQRGTINNLQVLLNRCNARWAREKSGNR